MVARVLAGFEPGAGIIRDGQQAITSKRGAGSRHPKIDAVFSIAQNYRTVSGDGRRRQKALQLSLGTHVTGSELPAPLDGVSCILNQCVRFVT